MNETGMGNEPRPGTKLGARVTRGLGSFGQRIKTSQIRGEIRKLDRSILGARAELARRLLSSPDLPPEIPLTPRLAVARDELRRLASQIDDASAIRDAEGDRERALENERRDNVEPLRHALEKAETEREEVRIREERAAREGLAIARRRDALDRELQAAPQENESEFDLLRRRHAVEELEAIERRAANLVVERDQLGRGVAAAERRLLESRNEYTTRAAEWDAPIAEARAHRQGAEGRIAALERLARKSFEDVSDEAIAWGDSWRKLAERPDDVETRRGLADLEELVRKREELLEQVAAAGASSESTSPPAGDSRMFLWIAIAGAGMLLVASTAVIALGWLWLGRSSSPTELGASASIGAAARNLVPLDDLLRSLGSQGYVLKSEEIAFAATGATDGRRIFPFADTPGAVELFEFPSEGQARDVRRRMERLLPDPRDTLFAENSDQAGRFLIWGLAQFPPAERRALRTAFRSAARR